MKYLILILLIGCTSKPKPQEPRPCNMKYTSSNSGHRIGGDVVVGGRDNHLPTLKEFMRCKGNEHKSFRYLELDVNSTQDNYIAVYHNKSINGVAVKAILFEDMPKGTPKLMDILGYLNQIKFRGLILVEIKRIHNHASYVLLINIVEMYQKMGLDIKYLAFPGNLNKTYCGDLKTVYEAMKPKNEKHNLCKGN